MRRRYATTHSSNLAVVVYQPAGQHSPANQPLSRLDNAVDAVICAASAEVLLETYLQARGRAGTPTHILLDLDGTADPTHGAQEGSAYHGYLGQHMYHPLLIFDGETDQLISARLRPGNAHASWDAVDELERITTAIRACWPDITLPAPVEGLREFIACMLDVGLTEDEISLMVCRNPARLLGLDEESGK
jgi:hypothetical protein